MTNKNRKDNGDVNKKSSKGIGNAADRQRRKLIIISAVLIPIIVGGIVASLFLYKPPQSASALVIDGIPCDSTEHTVYHTHTHLDIFVNGQPYEVPGRIGIEPSNCLFWLHTHSSDGIIHIESPENKIMTLGQLFNIWQKTYSEVQQFPKAPDGSVSPSVYINGEKVVIDDYRDAKIFPNTEIAIVYGQPPSKIPTTYVFGKTDLKIGGTSTELVQKILAPSTPASGPLGDKNAPITIVEFGDYQCNSCGIFHRETKDAVMSNLVDTGKAKFLFKDYTLNDYVLQPTRGSTLAAEAAYCAGDQEKFWQYHDELYSNQKQEGTVWISEDSLKEFASNVAVSDIAQFSKCLDSHKYETTVKANNELVRELGLNATPTFIIISSDGKNPVKLVGAYPYTSFEAVINQMLT